MSYNKIKVGINPKNTRGSLMDKIPVWLGLSICSLAVGVGLIMVLLEAGMLPSKALLAGLLAFMIMRILTGYLLTKVSQQK